MHGLFPQSLMFSYSILTWLFISLLNLKLLIDLFFLVFVFFLFVFLFLLNFSFELFLFWLCLFFCTHVWLLFFLFFRHLSFHQRCPSTSVSNSIESFCVPRSWTANFSRRSKRHRTHGERLLRSFHLINQIFLPKQKKNKTKKKTYFLLQAACIAVAALMQYFLMAAFCWMLVEGIYLYLFVVKVYNINTKMHMYHVISWGISMTYFITTCIGGSTVLSYLVLSSSQVLWIYFFVFMSRSPYDHDGHFTWHCCCERRNTKLCQW